MNNSVSIKKPVPTILTAVVLTAALALSVILHFAYQFQAEAETWYPDQYTLN